MTTPAPTLASASMTFSPPATLPPGMSAKAFQREVETMRTAIDAATGQTSLKRALRWDRKGRQDPVLQAVRAHALTFFPGTGIPDLSWTAKRGAVGSMELLLDAGADPNRLVDPETFSADVRDQLAQQPVVDPRDPPLIVALDHAARCTSSTTAAQAAPKVIAMVDRLLDAGANPNARSRHGLPVLHHLVQLPGLWFDGVAERLASRLVQGGADPTLTEAKQGGTALHTLVLCSRAPLALMDHLERLGVLATLRDAHGRTPLDRLLEPRSPQTLFFPTSGAKDFLHRLTVRSEQTVLGQAFDETVQEAPVPVVRSRL